MLNISAVLHYGLRIIGMTAPNICNVCGKPKERSGGGFATQFVNVCACESFDPSQGTTVTLCKLCGKGFLLSQEV